MYTEIYLQYVTLREYCIRKRHVNFKQEIIYVWTDPLYLLHWVNNVLHSYSGSSQLENRRRILVRFLQPDYEFHLQSFLRSMSSSFQVWSTSEHDFEQVDALQRRVVCFRTLNRDLLEATVLHSASLPRSCDNDYCQKKNSKWESWIDDIIHLLISVFLNFSLRVMSVGKEFRETNTRGISLNYNCLLLFGFLFLLFLLRFAWITIYYQETESETWSKFRAYRWPRHRPACLPLRLPLSHPDLLSHCFQGFPFHQPGSSLNV